MRTIFFLKDSFILYWDNVVMAMGLLLFSALFYTFYVSNGGKRRICLLYLPLAVGFSLALSRILYWFCHQEQYAGIKSAFQNLFTTGYCMTGVLIGGFLAAALVRLMLAEKTLGRLLDALGPATAFSLGVFRLSALFNETCRGKIEVHEEDFRKLPFAATITNAIGETEYRLATFMLEAILFFFVFCILCILFIRINYGKKYKKLKFPRTGTVYLLSVIGISSVELIFDSTRYDSCFMPFNGFVSLVQILSAVFALVACVILFVRSIKQNGCHFITILGLILFVGCIAGVGITEYLIQRHGDWYRSCYLGMGSACVLLDILAVCFAFGRRKSGNDMADSSPQDIKEVFETEKGWEKETEEKEKKVPFDTLVIKELDADETEEMKE